MQDARGEPITVSRDLHLESDEGDCIAGKVVAASDTQFELTLFPPKAERHFADVTLRLAGGLNVTMSEGSTRWHWPRDCKKKV
jgi:hypothetical protein